MSQKPHTTLQWLEQGFSDSNEHSPDEYEILNLAACQEKPISSHTFNLDAPVFAPAESLWEDHAHESDEGDAEFRAGYSDRLYTSATEYNRRHSVSKREESAPASWKSFKPEEPRRKKQPPKVPPNNNGTPHESTWDPSDTEGEGQKGRPLRKVSCSVKMLPEDAAFVIGRYQRTLKKVSTVSRCWISTGKGRNSVELWGTERACKVARKYIRFIVAQREGHVKLDAQKHNDGDLTVTEVPQACVPHINGLQGSVLRPIETNWSTLMFFADEYVCNIKNQANINLVSGLYKKLVGKVQTPSGIRKSNKIPHSLENKKTGPMAYLAIFGSKRARVAAELRVLSILETCIQGFISENLTEFIDPSITVGTDVIRLPDDNLSHLKKSLNLDGNYSTSQSILKPIQEIASGPSSALPTPSELIENFLIVSATKNERERFRRYCGILSSTNSLNKKTLILEGFRLNELSVAQRVIPKMVMTKPYIFCDLENHAMVMIEPAFILILGADATSRERAVRLVNLDGGQAQLITQTPEVEAVLRMSDTLEIESIIEDPHEDRELSLEELRNQLINSYESADPQANLETLTYNLRPSLVQALDLPKLVYHLCSQGIFLKLVGHVLSIKFPHSLKDSIRTHVADYIHNLQIKETFTVSSLDVIRLFIAKGETGLFRSDELISLPNISGIESNVQGPGIVNLGNATGRISGEEEGLISMQEYAQQLRISMLEYLRKLTGVWMKVSHNEIFVKGRCTDVMLALQLLQRHVDRLVKKAIYCSTEKQIRTIREISRTRFQVLPHFAGLTGASIETNTDHKYEEFLARLVLQGTRKAVEGAEHLVCKFLAKNLGTPPETGVEPYLLVTLREEVEDIKPDDFRFFKATEQVRLREIDSAFVLGKQGKTKQKLAAVSGAAMELLEDKNSVEIFGNEFQRRRAIKYVRMIRAQREGPTHVHFEDDNDDDLNTLEVPHNCVAFVTGSGGCFLRQLEEDWKCMMFFCNRDFSSKVNANRNEILVIFSPDERSRRGALLKVLAAIDSKMLGYARRYLSVGDGFVEDRPTTEVPCPPLCQTKSDTGLAMNVSEVTDLEVAFALGKDGGTKKKLSRASHAVLEFVGNFACIYGTQRERTLCGDYLCWLLRQRGTTRLSGLKIVMESIDQREDILIAGIEKRVLNSIKHAVLRDIEEKTRTYVFLEHPNICFICAADADAREKAFTLLSEELATYDENVKCFWRMASVKEAVHAQTDAWDDDWCLTNQDGHRQQPMPLPKSPKADRTREELLSVKLYFPQMLPVSVIESIGPSGENPVIDDLESILAVKARRGPTEAEKSLIINKSKNYVLCRSTSSHKLSDCQQRVAKFLDMFHQFTFSLRLVDPENIFVLNQFFLHYIRPRAWICDCQAIRQETMLETDLSEVYIVCHEASLQGCLQTLQSWIEGCPALCELLGSPAEWPFRQEPIRNTIYAATIVGASKSAPTRTEIRPFEVVRSTHNSDVVKVEEADAGFLVGTREMTRKKLSQVSGATMEMHERDMTTITVTGNLPDRQRALRYVNMVRQQRVGKVYLSLYNAQFEADRELARNCLDAQDELEAEFLDPETHYDYSILQIPSSCVGLVIGKHGYCLRELEAECRTLIFIVEEDDSTFSAKDPDLSSIAIMSPSAKDRKQTVVYILSALESKINVLKFFPTSNYLDPSPGFGTDTLHFQFIPNIKKRTKENLRSCSGCVIEIIRNVGIFAGSLEERQKARFYCQLTFSAINDDSWIVMDPNSRDDVSFIVLPEGAVEFLSVGDNLALSIVEESADVLAYFVKCEDKPALAIIGQYTQRLIAELLIMRDLEKEFPGYFDEDYSAAISRIPFVGKERRTETRKLSETGVTLKCACLNLSQEQMSGGSDPREIVLADIFKLSSPTVIDDSFQETYKLQLISASECFFIDVVGSYIFLCGTAKLRRRARWCMSWLLLQTHQLSPEESLCNGFESVAFEGMKEFSRIVSFKELPTVYHGDLYNSLKSVERRCGFVTCLMGVDEIAICGINAKERQFAEEKISHIIAELLKKQRNQPALGEVDQTSDNLPE